MIWLESIFRHIGSFWFSPDDSRVIIVSGKGELAGQYVLLGKNADVQAQIAETIRPKSTPTYGTLDEAKRAAEAFFAVNSPKTITTTKAGSDELCAG